MEIISSPRLGFSAKMTRRDFIRNAFLGVPGVAAVARGATLIEQGENAQDDVNAKMNRAQIEAETPEPEEAPRFLSTQEIAEKKRAAEAKQKAANEKQRERLTENEKAAKTRSAGYLTAGTGAALLTAHTVTGMLPRGKSAAGSKASKPKAVEEDSDW